MSQVTATENKNNVEKVIETINNSLANISCIIIIGLGALLTLSALARYIIRTPWPWSVEVSAILFGVCTLLSVGYTLNKRGYIAFELIVEKLRGLARLRLELIGAVFSLFYFIFLAVAGQIIFRTTVQLQYGSDQLQIPSAIYEWALPLGFGLLALTGLLIIIRLVINIRALTRTGRQPVIAVEKKVA